MKQLKKVMTLAVVACAALLLVSAIGCGNANAPKGEQKQETSAPSQTADNKDNKDNKDGKDSKDEKKGEGDLGLLQAGTLKVCSDFQFPPLEYIDDKNQPTGFGVEMVNALGKKMGLKVEWSPALKFDTLVPMIAQGGKYDIACASISITDERKQQVNFSTPYLDSNLGIGALKTGVQNIEELDQPGKKIAVQSGSTGEAWANENLKNAEVVIMDDNVATFAAVQAGQVDAIGIDLPVLQWSVKNSYKDMQVIKEIPTGEQYGLAISKNNPALAQAIDKALAEIKQDGTYQQIFDKYFK